LKGERWKVEGWGIGAVSGWSAYLMLKCIEGCHYHHDAHGGACARAGGWELGGGRRRGGADDAQYARRGD
jgi:hypothetical protein